MSGPYDRTTKGNHVIVGVIPLVVVLATASLQQQYNLATLREKEMNLKMMLGSNLPLPRARALSP